LFFFFWFLLGRLKKNWGGAGGGPFSAHLISGERGFVEETQWDFFVNGGRGGGGGAENQKFPRGGRTPIPLGPGDFFKRNGGAGWGFRGPKNHSTVIRERNPRVGKGGNPGAVLGGGGGGGGGSWGTFSVFFLAPLFESGCGGNTFSCSRGGGGGKKTFGVFFFCPGPPFWGWGGGPFWFGGGGKGGLQGWLTVLGVVFEGAPWPGRETPKGGQGGGGKPIFFFCKRGAAFFKGVPLLRGERTILIFLGDL